MKKLLLAAAVSTLSLSAAQAAPTLYGKVNVSVDQFDNKSFGTENVTEVNSNASRIGVKGEEKISDKLSAVYLAEWEISVDGDEDDSQTFKKRNIFGGLKWADIGTLKVGNYDSYFKSAAASKNDIFNDHAFDITSMMYGEERLKNVIGFETDPKLLAGIGFNLMLQQGEENKKDGDNGIGDAISSSITYENKDLGLAVALGADFDVKGKYSASTFGSTKQATDAFRLAGSYDLGKVGVAGLGLNALYQTAEATSDEGKAANLEEDAWVINAAYKIAETPVTVKAQYQSADTSEKGQKDKTVDQYGLGVDYTLNKQAKLYGLVAQQKRDWTTTKTPEKKQTVFGVGLELNF
ncbi:porin [Acinetobacter chinensis]|uniref:Porin n=1 Tax=Acinetobacter chinensis TaxID=2004650 RepID=A0ABU3WF96_9GAMM|nr:MULTISPECIES: porin [Acinetobacter]AXY60256.1 porin [Acinetobacter sp. WCHAc010052]MDV2469065.1 porin [Acinetobacter chinensis]